MAPKRSFYEDEELITTKPGYNSEISKELKEKESAHGNISFIEGMGVRTTPYLEKHFNNLRSYLHDKFSIAAAELGTQRTAVANEWSTFKNKVDEVILEPVIPDCVNVIFPVLITSVAVGRRSLPVRFLATSAAFGLSVKYYMPRTYGAAKSKLLLWEKENYPDLWKKQQEIGEQTRDLIAETNNLRAQLKQDLQKQIHEARLWVAKLLED
ncbi:CIC11C00000003699 [Sungouiella intermedia]|uniref:MICOS complex subunit n=1 Tax=Sungouiella intermedia TaxID=45354 RepID=A0A1L0DK55_9ASCO|nr:CIC11C00000003699 [[Candida] intermedia]